MEIYTRKILWMHPKGGADPKLWVGRDDEDGDLWVSAELMGDAFVKELFRTGEDLFVIRKAHPYVKIGTLRKRFPLFAPLIELYENKVKGAWEEHFKNRKGD